MLLLQVKYLDIKRLSLYDAERREGDRGPMFEMHPGALEQGMARRHELVRSSWTPRRTDDRGQRRVAEVVRFRHAVATLVAAVAR
jgi:hypothetical protein